MRADILDATTGQSLFTCPVAGFLSVGISLDVAFVAFLKCHKTVEIWNAHTLDHESINVGYDVFNIALSPDGSHLASLSPSNMKLWDPKGEGCLAHLEFDRPLQVEPQISFSINGTSVSLLKNSGTQNWRIAPNHNIDLTIYSIRNSDGTKSRLISDRRSQMKSLDDGDGTMLPMVFVPTTDEWPNQDAPALCRSYRCDTDGEWILDQDGMRVLWIPPDERPRKFWCFKRERKILIQTENGKIYFVNFS
jgi:WD40 repeat protein